MARTSTRSMAFSTPSIVLPLVGVAFWLWIKNRHSNRHYPPGPPSWPFIGNLLRLPGQHPWLRLTEWKETYGQTVYLHGLGGTTILFLNNVNLAVQLFEKRPTIYSERPRFTVAGDLLGLDKLMPLRMHDHGWKLQRKLARSAMSLDAVKRYHPLLEEVATMLSESLRVDPETFTHHIRLALSRVILSVTYGIPVATSDNEFVVLVEEAMKVISKATNPGAYLADLFPILKQPHALLFRNDIQRNRRIVQDSLNKPFDHVKKQIVDGSAPPSLVQQLLADEGDKEFASRQEYENTVKWLAGSLYLAGVETVNALVLTTLLAMAMNPDKQARAQEEIDAVVGIHRLPTLGDKGSLPYMEAVIKEAMRWYPSVPLSLGRRTSQDDVYEGHFIPAGTNVFPNIWFVSTVFMPERFLDENPPVDPTNYAFGFGRRICPGKQLAEHSVFIVIASILAAFRISPETDSSGKPIPYDARFSSGLISAPEDFRCKFRPRSEERGAQVRARAAAVSYVA
ncbi:cytochrome P450 [Pleurotus eryngii]|uniref:Cytochrome P450 n=1 Tax=Pleurotus eryngii TaxID=5323 RepID=A0A9P5ZL85_PLEER|nr:cytochrome P450 [Pleurotus eryngii]